MDAYSSYIMQVSDARLGELRQEAAEYAMSRAARRPRTSLWSQARGRLLGPRHPALEFVAPLPVPTTSSNAELRRSA